jgi:hypothetical protein
MQNIETLNDLIEALTELAECEDKDGNAIGDLPVCIAHQQNWPLAESISAVTVAERDGMKVWLAASPAYNLDYAPRDAWEGGIEGIDFEDEWE